MKFHQLQVLAFILILLTSCAKSPTPDNPALLTVYGDVNRVFEKNSTEIGSINDFIEIHPEIKVEVIPEYSEWTIREETLRMLRDPKAKQPDIIEMPGSWAASFAQEGLLLPIGKWYDNLPRREKMDFLQPAVVGYKYGKELYGLPSLIGVQYLYGRKDLLPESGLPQTLEELVSATRYIKKKHNIQGLIFPSKGLNLYKFYYTLLQIVLDGQEEEDRLTAHIAVYKTFKILVQENQPDYEKFDHVISEGEFRSGRAGMSINGNYVWYLLSLSKEVGFPVRPEHVAVGFLPMLKPEAHRVNHIWTRGYAINKRTKHPQQALELLHHLTSERADFMRLKNKYILPARKSAEQYGEKLPGMAPEPARALYARSKGAPGALELNESPDNWYDTASKMLDLLKEALKTDMETLNFVRRMLEIEKGIMY
ncbi:ABC transporter substrate-binding protein [Desulfovibrio sp. JC022]|uniref:ABC transporter substrate-binding protein n=1 Tax=Desulfovibrio sp. JC022 TaxID=2593642 RepID=UPI0013D0B1D5|nr:extracellular solute-binding protein [Desulfovibrio sp. JC022]NDV24274.1 extracellular solute-binding protein [Desulfovibrio sp. JC022]